MRIRNIGATVAALALSAVSLTMAGPAAQAENALKFDIPAGPGCGFEICTWGDDNYKAPFGVSAGINGGLVNNFGNGGNPLGGGQQRYDDVISSIVNTTGHTVCFYSDPFGKGLEFKIHGFEKWPGLPSWINDKISSMKYC